MKHIIPIMRFSYDKIIHGTKRIEMRLYDEEYQKIHLNDIIEFVCSENGDRLLCLVRGVVVFERFDDIIELFPLRIFGYDNKEEVKVRINRRYSFEEQLRQHAMGIILMPLQDESIEKRQGDEYIPKERNEVMDWEKSHEKNFTKVRQLIDKEEQYWQPISQHIEHCEDEGIDAEQKKAELLKLRYAERSEYER